MAVTSDGQIAFHVSVRVNVNEMETWEPDRIKAFFGGISQVLAAKDNNTWADRHTKVVRGYNLACLEIERLEAELDLAQQKGEGDG